jgi:hypothetical protein
MVVIPVILVLGKWRQEDSEFETSQGYIGRPCLKKNKNRAGGVIQVVECLLSKREAMSTNQVPPKN